jgi:ATP-dependent Clp protease adaptor protein ClpS
MDSAFIFRFITTGILIIFLLWYCWAAWQERKQRVLQQQSTLEATQSVPDGQALDASRLTEPSMTKENQHHVASNHSEQWKIYLLNDDITSMEFVVAVLQAHFRLTVDQARAIMLEAHQQEAAFIAQLPYHTAQDIVQSIMQVAREQGYPLQFELRPDEHEH